MTMNHTEMRDLIALTDKRVADALRSTMQLCNHGESLLILIAVQKALFNRALNALVLEYKHAKQEDADRMTALAYLLGALADDAEPSWREDYRAGKRLDR